MNQPAKAVLLVLVLFVSAPVSSSFGESDIEDVPSQKRTVGDDENKRYFLIGDPAAEPPEDGLGLIVVMPGGDGGEGFHPFVKRIYNHAAPDGYLIAQPVAFKWSDKQQVVWPTARDRVRGMRFPTERFVADVVKDVEKLTEINPDKRLCLVWSSSGPAAYAIALQKTQPFAGFYIAMSVFKPNRLPALNRAEGLAFHIEHSPDDRVCPFRMAEQARDLLTDAGADVNFVTYDGGHGWQGAVWQRMSKGLAWLDERAAESQDTEPAP